MELASRHCPLLSGLPFSLLFCLSHFLIGMLANISSLILYKPLRLFLDSTPAQRDISLCNLEIPNMISQFLDSYCSADMRPLSTADWVSKQPIISWVNCHLSSFLDLTFSGTRETHQRSPWAWYALLNCCNNQALCGAYGAELQNLEESKWISTCQW